MSMESKVDEWLAKLVWLWLPFYALWHLIQEVAEGKKNDSH
jgi:hypothetical protein